MNDPIKGAAAIITVATTPKPPTRIQLGVDAVNGVDRKLRHVTDELRQWRDLSASTSHE